MKKEKKNMHGRRKMSEFFCCCCCCVHLSFFLSRFQNELQLYFHSRVVKRTTGRIARFPLHRLFLFLFLRLCVGAEFASGKSGGIRVAVVFRRQWTSFFSFFLCVLPCRSCVASGFLLRFLRFHFLRSSCATVIRRFLFSATVSLFP